MNTKLTPVIISTGNGSMIQTQLTDQDILNTVRAGFSVISSDAKRYASGSSNEDLTWYDITFISTYSHEELMNDILNNSCKV